MTEAKRYTDGGAENKAEADGHAGWGRGRGRGRGRESLRAATEFPVRALPEPFL